MESKRFFITILESDLTHKKIVKVFCDGQRFAEIFIRDGELILQLYRSSKSTFFEFPFDDAIETLERAKDQLLRLSGPDKF